jgi:SAM-dependent methyltransferase
MRKPKIITQLEYRARRSRAQLLTHLLRPLQRPIRILDVGGEFGFWEILDFTQLGEIHVTLLNLFPQDKIPPNFCSQVGDARSMQGYATDDFDVVLSNSVIGHVGSFQDQKSMANEIRRIGKRYYVQTPNHYFPVDWRTLIPLFHFLPLNARARLLHSLPITSFGRLKSYSTALQWASAVRNLTYFELRVLFPEATITRERVLGFTKSFMVSQGFDSPSVLTDE